MNNALLIQHTWGGGIRLQEVGLYFQYHADYCAQWNWDYHVHCGEVPRMNEPFRPWNKIALAQEAVMQGYEYIVLMDTDAFIADPKADLRKACVKEVNMARWWKGQPVEHYQAGVIYLHSFPKKNTLYKVLTFMLEEAKYYLARKPDLRGWFEQGQMMEMSEMPFSKEYFHEIDVKYNWCPDWCEPCKSPVVRSFHGISPVEEQFRRIKEAVEISYSHDIL